MPRRAKDSRQFSSAALLIGLATTGYVLFSIPAIHANPESAIRSSAPADWFSPPPKDVNPNRGIFLPPQLIKPVNDEFQASAAAMLGTHRTITLTSYQVRQFGGIEKPEEILNATIEDLSSSLKAFERYPIDETVARDNVDAQQLRTHKQRQEDSVRHLRSKIATFRSWANRLKPYLVKAVRLKPRGVFGANLQGQTLLIVTGGTGGQAVEPVRCAVIVYLPVEPRRVYTAISLLR